MKPDWSAVSQDKQQRRKQAAERPVAEKLRVLERLRDRNAQIKQAAAQASRERSEARTAGVRLRKRPQDP